MTIQRWEFWRDMSAYCACDMEKEDDGSYVLHADFLTECRACESRLAKEAEVREKLGVLIVGFLNDLDKWESDGELSMHPARLGHYITEIRAALAAAKGEGR